MEREEIGQSRGTRSVTQREMPSPSPRAREGGSEVEENRATGRGERGATERPRPPPAIVSRFSSRQHVLQVGCLHLVPPQEQSGGAACIGSAHAIKVSKAKGPLTTHHSLTAHQDTTTKGPGLTRRA